MVLARRALVLAAPLLLARPVRAAVTHAAAGRLEVGPEGFVALTGPGVRRALLLPAPGARLLAPLACGGEVVTVAAFALEGDGARMEWAALAVAQDGMMALLALEPLSWRAPGGARMGTRLVATGDRRNVLCQRDTAVPVGPTLWRREVWTDTLAWRTPAGLVDAPVRPPLAGTRQHAVAAWRARAAALVAAGPAELTPALLAGAGLAAEGFTLAAGYQGAAARVSGKAFDQANQ